MRETLPAVTRRILLLLGKKVSVPSSTQAAPAGSRRVSAEEKCCASRRLESLARLCRARCRSRQPARHLSSPRAPYHSRGPFAPPARSRSPSLSWARSPSLRAAFSRLPKRLGTMSLPRRWSPRSRPVRRSLIFLAALAAAARAHRPATAPPSRSAVPVAATRLPMFCATPSNAWLRGSALCASQTR